MNKDEIFNMPAGEQIDKLIAIKVLGYPELDLEDAPCPYCGNIMRFCGSRSWCSLCSEWRHSAYKKYSDEISSAWEIVEKLTDGETPNDCELRTSVRGWRCDLYKGYANAETAPLAICRAALLSASSL